MSISKKIEIPESLIAKLEEMKKRQQMERNSNFKLLYEYNGLSVSYGGEIQLMHYDSRQFLNGKIMASSNDKSSYQLELSDDFSYGMMFKIYPKYKLRQVGDSVKIIDNVLIQNTKLGCYINLQTDGSTNQNKIESSFKVEEYQIWDFRKEKIVYPHYELFLSQFSDCQWSFEIFRHSTLNLEENVIQGSELITLKHTE